MSNEVSLRNHALFSVRASPWIAGVSGVVAIITVVMVQPPLVVILIALGAGFCHGLYLPNYWSSPGLGKFFAGISVVSGSGNVADRLLRLEGGSGFLLSLLLLFSIWFAGVYSALLVRRRSILRWADESGR
ncbi:MAG: hypothetical protein KDN22_06685 [Verrucomicrobiae bacterium]|nr:hypothetical protein [Verrucomicrobiae bacterium]